MYQVISRADAMAQGLKHYFTGKPCRRGHVEPRLVSCFKCVVCAKESYDASRKHHPERYAGYSKKHYEANREKCIASVKASAKKNPERVKKNKRDDYHRNKEKYANARKAHYEKNREEALKRAKEYREQNREKICAYLLEWHKKNPNYGKEWREKNSDRAKAYQRERFQFRLKNDPGFKAARLVRQSLNKVLARVKIGKSGAKTAQILGYSFDQFRKHMERHFLPDMNWGNHGTLWHVDHVVPVAEMLRLGVSDPKKIHALSNLLPMYALENMRKKDYFTLSPPVMVA